MRYNISAGHNPEGKVACGAAGILSESRENRIIKDKLIQILRAAGYEVNDCTCDDGTSQGDVLSKAVAKHNSYEADLNVQIHFNSGRNDYIGDGSVGGTEVFLYSVNESNKVAIKYGKAVVEAISELGYRIRDDKIPDELKTNSSLYFLRKTKAPAILIECCFVDDKDDADLYNADQMAQAIAKGLMGGETSASVPVPAPTTPATGHYVGESVNYNKIYTTAASTKALTPKKTTGVITKILSGKANPYLIDGGTGWINDGCIAGDNAAVSVSTPSVTYYPAYTGKSNSISTAMSEMGIDGSRDHRNKVAAANGIAGYSGSYTQNVTMLTLLKQGKLVKA